ncbi:MAG: N-acetylmuramoyl-L-alanine amidase, partial [Clostridium sp.]
VSANSTVKVQYRVFLYSKDSRSWVDMTDGYTAPVDPKINTSIRINAPLEKGDNSFSIWVKRANQKPSKKEGYDGFISYKVKAKEYGGGGSGGESLPANINTVSIDKSQEKLGGTPTVTLTAKSSVKVQYAVYMYSVSKATWEDVIGGYSSACDPKSPKAIKINKPLKPGDNVLSIWVKRADKKPSDAGGYDDFEKRTIKIGTSPSKVVKISSITCEEGDAIVGHRPNINVRGTSGNNEDLKYKAYIYSNKKKTWTEASEFTSSLKSGELASIKLTTPLESGYNKIQVWAKRETVSGDVYEAFKTIEVFANRPSPMKKLVVVDPGHGGRDPGAGSTSGTKEKDIALIVSLKLGKLLEASGYDVIYTRVNDNVNWNSSIQSESLRYRYTFANEKGADMFVSLHCNAGGGTGIETYYSKKYPNKDKLLSDTIQSELIKATSMVDRRSKAGNFSVINNTKMPASLVELGFIDNIRDEAKLKDPFYQDQCAEAISRAVIKTLSFQ